MPDNTPPLYTDKTRPYTAGNFELRLDGEATGIYLKSVEGGFVKGQLVNGGAGPSLLPIRQVGTPKIDPITVEFGASSSQGMMNWIKSSWEQGENFEAHDGVITHANQFYHEQFYHQFRNALIMETTFPSLDGASKEGGYIKCKFQPGEITLKKTATTNVLKTDTNEKQKEWLPAMFRLNLDGISGMEFTNKIDSFTIKQNLKELAAGVGENRQGRTPQYTPTNLEFPNLVGYIGLSNADGLLAWYQKYVIDGATDSGSQINGSIEFLSPSGKKKVLEIDLFDVGILSLEIMKSEANSEQMKRVKFELFIGRMVLDVVGNYYDTSF